MTSPAIFLNASTAPRTSPDLATIAARFSLARIDARECRVFIPDFSSPRFERARASVVATAASAHARALSNIFPATQISASSD